MPSSTNPSTVAVSFAVMTVPGFKSERTMRPKTAGATEELKSRDQMAWVGLMNNCKAKVEEIIFSDLIYH